MRTTKGSRLGQVRRRKTWHCGVVGVPQRRGNPAGGQPASQWVGMPDDLITLEVSFVSGGADRVASLCWVNDSGEEQKGDEDTAPTVSPRLMAEAITEMKARFGNVDEFYDTGFVKRLLTIADEAEAVALDLAGGKELTSRQQQDMAWEQGSVSVWDLGQVEEEAHQEGKLAVWEQEAQDQMARQESASRQTAIEKDFQ